MTTVSKDYPPIHNSIRGYFAYHLWEEMSNNPDIVLITADLGYGMFDYIKRDFPTRFINTGAAELTALGVAVGMALSGKLPIVYSITPFLLARGNEIIRNYINHEQIKVILVGGGIDRDYSHDGISHWADDTESYLHCFPNIIWMQLTEKEQVQTQLLQALLTDKPTFLQLKR